MEERFGVHNNEFRQSVMQVQRRNTLAHPMSEFLGTITICIVLWYGGTLILGHNSSIDASTFIYYLIIFYSIINPAKDLSRAAYSIRMGMASLERVDMLLLAESEIKDPAEPKPLSFKEHIRFEGVSFKYKEAWVLRNINLEVKKGQTVAIVGASGSGKSTLVDLIPRFYDVVEGRITIDGTDIREVTLQDLRALMGNVNQEAILFNDTVRNNIAFANQHAKMEEIERAARIANADEFILELPKGYNTNIGDRGGNLSGGQRQRLSIARAILEGPRRSHSRRSHLRPRYRLRAVGTGGSGTADERAHHHSNSPPPFHHYLRRCNSGDERGGNSGARHPRGANGTRWYLCQPRSYAGLKVECKEERVI